MEHKHNNEIKKRSVAEVIFLVIVGILLVFAIALTDPSPLTIIAAGISIALLPLFFFHPKIAFLILLSARPVIDFVGERVTVNIQDVLTINLNSIVSIFIFAWGITYLAIKGLKFWKIPVAPALIVLSGITLLSVLTSHSPINSFGEWVRITNFLVLLSLGYYFTRSYRDLVHTVLALFAATIIPFCFALYQLLTHSGISDEASANRLLGTFAHPALFGQFLAMIILVTIAGILLQKRSVVPLSAFLCVTLFFLLLTFTRGAWIFTALGVGILGVRFFRKYLMKIIATTGILLCIVFGAILMLQTFTDLNPVKNEFVSRITTSLSFSPQSSIVWRLRFWKSALNPLGKYLVTGYGAGTFFDYAIHELNTRFDAHNDYLKLTVELGLTGIFALLALFFSIARMGIRSVQRTFERKQQVIATALLALTAGIIFESFFDNLYQNTTFYWLFFALLGSALAYLKNTEKQKEV